MFFFSKIAASVKAKLFLCFLCIATIALLAGFFSMIPFLRLEGATRQIGHINLPSLLCINTIKDAQSQIVAAERTLLIRQLSDPEIRNGSYAIIENSIQEVEKAAGELESLGFSPEQSSVWRLFREAWQAWSEKQADLMGILHRQEELMVQGIRGGRQFDRIANQAFDLAFSDLRRHRLQANSHLDELGIMIRDAAVLAVDETTRTAQTYFRWQAMFLVAAFLLSLLFGLWLTGRISNPVLKSVGHIARVADGNLGDDVEPALLGQRGEIGLLSAAVQKLIESQRREVGIFKAIANGDYTDTVVMRSNQDELGQSVGLMMDVTNATLNRVNFAVSQVIHDATSINSASQVMSQGAMETASSLEEISASISQIGEKTRANAASADAADKLASASRATVDKGYAAVAEMISAMKDIQNTSAQIASVVKLIDDIAFQTNLLALNAAVEAARAGRHGRGFSIVADEVRNLAARSAKAAKETAQMLETTVGKLEKGSALAEHTDGVLRQVVDNAGQIASLFREVAKSSNEQSLGIDQIANGLSQIDRVTQRNTLTAGDTASAAVALLRQAEALRAVVEKFRLRRSGQGIDRDLPRRTAPGVPASREIPFREPRRFAELDYSGQPPPREGQN